MVREDGALAVYWGTVPATIFRATSTPKGQKHSGCSSLAPSGTADDSAGFETSNSGLAKSARAGLIPHFQAISGKGRLRPDSNVRCREIGAGAILLMTATICTRICASI